MPKQVRHDGDRSVVTLNNRLLPSITLPVTLNLFQGLFIIVTLNLFGGLPPILGAFYNATTFKMPKQVRHDRSVVTLNNILSHQTTACCHCTLHTCAKLVFSNVAQATYGKNKFWKLHHSHAPGQLRCTAAQYGYFLTRKTLVSRVKNSHTLGSFVIFYAAHVLKG